MTAKKAVEDEISRLGSLEQVVVKSLATGGPSRWKRIMTLTGSIHGKEPDRKSLTRSLASLVGIRIVERTAEGYGLVDPMYQTLEGVFP
ncbi:MAG: hypothetical protein JRN39_06210 [Nitrososphaerota archaeon]|nr:hypothetical protein [Nitrososphaerota archaeon]MDG6939976.1 hypothetical protein [Nitrososphaerota archaeon]